MQTIASQEHKIKIAAKLLAPGGLGSAFTIKDGKTTVIYNGNDKSIWDNTPPHVFAILGSTEAGIYANWEIPDIHLIAVIKHRADDPLGRWVRWDIRTDRLLVLKYPKSPTAKLFLAAVEIINAQRIQAIKDPRTIEAARMLN